MLLSKNEKTKSGIKFSLSNITTVFLVIFAAVVIFSPSAKGLLIQGLMKIGLFQPDIKQTDDSEHSNSTVSDIFFKDGKENIISLSDLKGKVVFINFWATWCPPCRAEMPSIESLYQKVKDNKNIVFLMVDVDNDYAKAKKYMDRKKLTLPVYTPASAIPETLMSGTIPTTLILDKKGQLVFKHEGAGDFTNQKVMDFLQQLSK